MMGLSFQNKGPNEDPEWWLLVIGLLCILIAATCAVIFK